MTVMDRATAAEVSRIRRSTSKLRAKKATAVIKAAPTDGSGTFVGLVSTFGPPPDTQGDIIHRDAFEKSLIRLRAEYPGELLPIWYGHLYQNPSNAIGVVTAARTTDEGLFVMGRLNLESTKALSVYEGLLTGALREYSIGYVVVHEEPMTWEGKKANLLTELELLEVSIVAAGANRNTRTIEVKHDGSADYARSADPVLQSIKSRLDELESPAPVRRIDPGVVEAFIKADREQRARERAEQKRLAALGDDLNRRAQTMSIMAADGWTFEDEQARDRERIEREMAAHRRREEEQRAYAAALARADEERRAFAYRRGDR